MDIVIYIALIINQVEYFFCLLIICISSFVDFSLFVILKHFTDILQKLFQPLNLARLSLPNVFVIFNADLYVLVLSASDI